jgi:multiple sugar transport system substrate-binding protein
VPQDELPPKVQAALDAGSPPDLALNLLGAPAISWAHEGRLVDLTATFAPVAAMFDPGSLGRWTLTDEQTGRRALYGLPVGRTGNHLHAWRSLLVKAGFSLDDIPDDWGQFWAFSCDQVQPAVRKALGRELSGASVRLCQLRLRPIPRSCSWRKGCTPPDATSWTNPDNNKAFLAQRW